MRLFEHQEEALDKMHDGCILWGTVGTGKSRTALAYYIDNHMEKDVYVITTAKKRDTLDWDREAANFAIGREHSAYGKLVVDSWNNIGKYTNVENAFFIFDEQRLVGSGAWVKSFIKISKKNKWIMLSATPGDTWMDFIPVFVANGFYKNRTEFLRTHVIYSSWSRYPKVEKYVGLGTLVKHRNEVLVKMMWDNRHTTRETIEVVVDYDKGTFDQAHRDRWNAYDGEPCRDIGEVWRVMRRATNSHPSRIDKLRELVRYHKRIIVFYNFDYELDILRGLQDEFVVAEWNGHKHEQIPDDGGWVYLVQYAAGSEGWNCITTDTMVFYSFPYSYKHWHQSYGRIDRINTPFDVLRYYVFTSKNLVDNKISGILRTKRSFNERTDIEI